MPGAPPARRWSWREAGAATQHGEQFKGGGGHPGACRWGRGHFEYLASGVVKGVRMGLAGRSWTVFGGDALAVIENEPESCVRLGGVSPKRGALAIGEDFRQKMGMRRLAEFLSGAPPAPGRCHALYQRFGDLLRWRWCGTIPTCWPTAPWTSPSPRWTSWPSSWGVAGDDPQRVEAALVFELGPQRRQRARVSCRAKGF